MDRILKILFFALLVKPVILVGLGLNIRGRSNLPKHGPAVIAANHNSHLDTMVLMSMYPLSRIHMIRPIAAADYFFRNKYLKWFSLNIIGIIPLDRSGKTNREALFTDCHLALDKGQTLLIFPEGSRGKPEELSKLRKGLFYLIKDRKEHKSHPCCHAWFRPCTTQRRGSILYPLTAMLSSVKPLNRRAAQQNLWRQSETGTMKCLISV